MPLSFGDDEPTTSGEGPGLLEQVFGGLAVGVSKDPLVDVALRHVVSRIPGVDLSTLEAMERELGSSPVVNASKFVGQFGPLLLGGLGIAKAGVAAGSALARGVAPRLATGGGRLASSAQRVQGAAEGTILGTPGLERGAQIGATAAGFGGLTGAETAAQGGSAGDIARGAAIGAALSVGLEGAFLLGAKALSPRSNIFGTDVNLAANPAGAAEAATGLRESVASLRREAQGFREKIFGKLGLRDDTDDIANQMQQAIAGVVDDVAPVPRGTMRRRAMTRPIRQLQRQLKQVKTAERAGERLLLRLEDPSTYTREVPLNPRTRLGEYLEETALAIMKSPEAFQGQLGPTMNRFLTRMKDAQRLIIAREGANLKSIGFVKREAIRLMGKKDFNKRFLQEVAKYEVGGVAAIPEGLQGVFLKIDQIVKENFTQLTRLGAEAAFTPRELRSLGINHFFPHLLGVVDDKVLREQLTAGGTRALLRRNPNMTPAQAEVRMDRVLADIVKQRDGLRQFGSVDAQRRVPGTLAQKIEDGLPLEEDPFLGLLNFTNAVARRVETGKVAGVNGELGRAANSPLKQAARTEGASPAIANSVIDVFTGGKYRQQFLREYSRRITNLQIASKLALAVIPNFSQTINTALFFGWKKALKGMVVTIGQSRASRAQLGQAIALNEEMFQIMRRQSLGQIGEGLTDKLADRVLGFTGFSAVEKMNRLIAGNTALFFARDTAAKAIAGRLRGQTLAVARRKMSKLGIQLDDVIAKGQLTEEQALRAAFKGVQETQFIPDALRRPSFWNSPAGRVIFQFKTFAMGQGRFLRDQVIRESAQGNHMPLASFLSLYPIAGEFVAQAQSLARQRDRDENGIFRVLDNLAAVGAFGVAQSAVQAAQFGRLAETLLGPTISDATEFAGAVLRFDASGVGRQITRQPIVDSVKLALGLTAAGSVWTAKEAQEYLDLLGTGGETESAIPLEELGRLQRSGGGGLQF